MLAERPWSLMKKGLYPWEEAAGAERGSGKLDRWGSMCPSLELCTKERPTPPPLAFPPTLMCSMWFWLRRTPSSGLWNSP